MKYMKIIATTAVSLSMLAASGSVFADAPVKQAISPVQKQMFDQEIHDYLLANPQIMMEMVQKLKQQQAEQQQKASEEAVTAILAEHQQMVNDPHAVQEGSAKAPITIVEFYDYQCSACAGTYPELEKFLSTDFAKKNVRVVYRSFPFFGPASVYATKAVIAAEAQHKSMDLHNALFKSGLIEGKLSAQAVDGLAAKIPGMNMTQLKKDINAKWVQQEMQLNSKLVKSINLQATPGLIFTPTDSALANVTNTHFINSGMPEQSFAKAANDTLKQLS